MSDEDWNFRSEDYTTKIYIENISKSKVLGTTSNRKVNLEDQKEYPLLKDQLWKVGVPDNEGYFTLESGSKRKFLTAISSSSLEISEGNLTLTYLKN